MTDLSLISAFKLQLINKKIMFVFFLGEIRSFKRFCKFKALNKTGFWYKVFHILVVTVSKKTAQKAWLKNGV